MRAGHGRRGGHPRSRPQGGEDGEPRAVDVHTLVREQLSEETGLRGFVATHDRYFLDPDGPPNPRFDQGADSLARAVVAAFRHRPARKGMPPVVSAYHSLISELSTSWQRFVEDAKRLDKELPDLCLMLEEAQELHNGWEPSTPSSR